MYDVVTFVSKPEMASKPITIRLPDLLLSRLEIYIADTNSSKTDVVVAALNQYLGTDHAVPLSEKVFQLEKRVSLLEANR